MTEEKEQVEKSACYCGTSHNSDILECNVCQKKIHPGCLTTGRPSPLAGDVYFDLTCRDCGQDGQESCTRKHISWMQTVYLALYNLSMTSSGRKGFFRWKEDICQFIERNWQLLIPKRKKTTSWHSTVAGTLSNGCPQYFKTGQKEFREAGWWSLQEKISPAIKIKTSDNKKKKSKGASKKRTSTFSLDSESYQDTKKLKESESVSISPVVSTSKQQEGPQTIDALETDSDDIIARLLTDNEEMSLNEAGFPLLDIDEPLGLIAEYDDKHNVLLADPDGVKDEQNKDECPYEEMAGYCANHEDISSLEEKDDQEKSETDSLVSSVKSELQKTIKTKDSEDGPCQIKDSRLVMVSEADEHEMLCRLNACVDVIQNDCVARRLRRKLILRKHKRENGLPVFNLDKRINSLLSSTKSYVFKDNDFVPLKSDDVTKSADFAEQPPKQSKKSFLTRYSRVLDRFLGAPQMAKRTDMQQRSFMSRLVGADREAALRPITSPYTARVLKPFIRRDFESRPLKLKLLNEILAHHERKDPLWVSPEPHPIDYCYVQPFHIPAVNAMCREFFWPGIDLSECLLYPDFSCVVLYRSFIIAFAFMVPDVKYNEAYISFILVHPEWRRAGIGTYMLYHLIQTCMGKDVTLHVSANNPAMLMYQKFGFKPEEFILDFYEKYLPENSLECRHAFFLRLRR